MIQDSCAELPEKPGQVYRSGRQRKRPDYINSFTGLRLAKYKSLFIPIADTLFIYLFKLRNEDFKDVSIQFHSKQINNINSYI